MTDKRCYSTASLILFEKIALFICAKRNFGWLYLKVARQPPVCRANGCLSESEQRVILGRELVDLAKYFQCFGRDFVLAVSQRVTGDLDQMRVGAAEAAADVGQGRKAINGQDDFRGGDVFNLWVTGASEQYNHEAFLKFSEDTRSRSGI